MPLQILIGGAPRSGKTTLAKNLSTRLNVAWISTDTLRKGIKADVKQKEQYPWIFSTVGVAAEEFWKNHAPQDVLKVELEQARELWPTIKNTLAAGQYGIIEGVSILPELAWRDFKNKVTVFFLIDPDRKRLEQTIYRYGMWSNSKPYPDWIKPLEVECVQLYNEWLRREIKKYPYPLVEVTDRATTLKKVLEHLK